MSDIEMVNAVWELNIDAELFPTEILTLVAAFERWELRGIVVVGYGSDARLRLQGRTLADVEPPLRRMASRLKSFKPSPELRAMYDEIKTLPSFAPEVGPYREKLRAFVDAYVEQTLKESP